MLLINLKKPGHYIIFLISIFFILFSIDLFGKSLFIPWKYYISVREKDWYLCASPNPTLEPDRGLIRYKEYYKYKTGGGAELLRFGDPDAVTNIDYFVKPGPYNVDNGPLEAWQIESETVQRSLVFDYDFTIASNMANAWVGAIKKDIISYQYGEYQYIDFSSCTNLTFWVKLLSVIPTAKVQLYIDIGRFSEDIDNDGILDEESGIYDGGFFFNPPNGVATWIGGGAKYDANSQANNVLDTEDLDKNGYLDKLINEKYISFPSGPANNYALTEGGQSVLTVSNSTNWQQVRISLNKNALLGDLVSLLKNIKNIRIRINNNTADKGKLLLHNICFSGYNTADLAKITILNNPIKQDGNLEMRVLSLGSIIKIYTASGKTIKEFTADANNTQNGIFKTKLSSLNISAGVYFVLIKHGNEKVTKKIIYIR